MNTFNLTKALGIGALLWLIMFAVISALVGFGVATESAWIQTLMILLSGALAYSFTLWVKPTTFTQGAGYGLVFAIVGIAFDLIISARFTNGMFTSWTYWIGYAAVLLAPMLEEQVTEPAHGV